MVVERTKIWDLKPKMTLLAKPSSKLLLSSARAGLKAVERENIHVSIGKRTAIPR
jgi:hypothetical protein